MSAIENGIEENRRLSVLSPQGLADYEKLQAYAETSPSARMVVLAIRLPGHSLVDTLMYIALRLAQMNDGLAEITAEAVASAPAKPIVIKVGGPLDAA